MWGKERGTMQGPPRFSRGGGGGYEVGSGGKEGPSYFASLGWDGREWEIGPSRDLLLLIGMEARRGHASPGW